jgi:hypothetical protein
MGVALASLMGARKAVIPTRDPDAPVIDVQVKIEIGIPLAILLRGEMAIMVTTLAIKQMKIHLAPRAATAMIQEGIRETIRAVPTLLWILLTLYAISTNEIRSNTVLGRRDMQSALVLA